MINEESELTEAQKLRLKAERKLQLKQEKSELDAMGISEKRLLHELQVHQIELEMQNEELLRANEITEKALKKYTMLYDFAPMGYYTLNAEGSICDLNFTGAEILGDRRISLMNSNFRLYVSEESKAVFDKFFSKVFTGGMKAFCEIKLGFEIKNFHDVYMEGIVTGDDHSCLLSVVDMIAFKR